MARNVVVIVLYDKDKKILLQHRTEDAKTPPGYWGFFGGGIEPGETPEQAIRRETMEELNYRLRNPRFILKNDFYWNGEMNEMHVFAEEYDQDKELTLWEGQGMGWYDLSALPESKMVAHDLDTLNLIKWKYYIG
jgi:8-oxo-dGTP diphosphatase